MRAIGYIRVSTDEQALGLDSQRSQLAAWCAGSGCELAAVHCDRGVSGGASLDKRPALMEAVASLAKGDLLLVAKRDRLARDTMIAAMVERLVERKGARIVSADGSCNGEGPEAQLMRAIIDAFAQYERALIRTRVKAALAVKRKRLEFTGVAPIGFSGAKDVVPLAVDEYEQATVARIIELRGDGLSIRGIVAQLNGEGRRARGKRWHPTSVARVLRRHDGASAEGT